MVYQCQACLKYMKNKYQWKKFKHEAKMLKQPEFLKFIIKNIKGLKKSSKVVNYKIENDKSESEDVS